MMWRVIKMSLGGACQPSLGAHIFSIASDQSGKCLPEQSEKCLPDQSGTSYFHYYSRLDVFFYSVIQLTSLVPNIFTIAPDQFVLDPKFFGANVFLTKFFSNHNFLDQNFMVPNFFLSYPLYWDTGYIMSIYTHVLHQGIPSWLVMFV